jgi:hypothetical protein
MILCISRICFYCVTYMTFFIPLLYSKNVAYKYVGTLDQGYPLLRYEGMMPVRLSLAARRIAPRVSREQLRWRSRRQRHRAQTSSRRRRTPVHTIRTLEVKRPGAIGWSSDPTK